MLLNPRMERPPLCPVHLNDRIARSFYQDLAVPVLEVNHIMWHRQSQVLMKVLITLLLSLRRAGEAADRHVFGIHISAEHDGRPAGGRQRHSALIGANQSGFQSWVSKANRWCLNCIQICNVVRPARDHGHKPRSPAARSSPSSGPAAARWEERRGGPAEVPGGCRRRATDDAR